MPEVSESATNTAAARRFVRLPFIFIISFSLLYFADVVLRASEKVFWYDELLTVYFARLDLSSLWNAILSGVDFNPPLFYLLTRAAEQVFGEGPVTARIPEMIGFWVFCLCLYGFVKRRAGIAAGLIAMLFPLLTGAFYYSYEARPHALVLGCCGLAMLCWQRWEENPASSRRWLVGFGLSLFLAFMLHCYALLLAIPFAVSELFRFTYSRRLRVEFWLALLTPMLPALLLYLPLLISYQATTRGTPFATWFPANWSQVGNCYSFLLYPVLPIVVLVLAFFVADRSGAFSHDDRQEARRRHVPQSEVVLALTFLAMPVFGVLLAKAVHGPFFARYFQSALAGLCVLLGIGCAAGRRRSWMAIGLTAILVVAFGLSFTRLLWHWHRGWPEPLSEPSTGVVFDGTPENPLLAHPLLSAAGTEALPVDILNPFDYLYFVHYAPNLQKRLYCALPSRDDISYRILTRLRERCGVRINALATYQEFRKDHHEFLIYGDFGVFWKLAELEGSGVEVGRLVAEGNRFLVRVRIH